MTRCYGFFGSIKVAYFAADDTVGIHMSDWTIEQVDAIRAFASDHDDDSTREWANELIGEWSAKFAPTDIDHPSLPAPQKQGKTMDAQQWENKLKSLESIAFRQLVTLARTVNGSGMTTAKHFADEILKMETVICNSIGDCPEDDTEPEVEWFKDDDDDDDDLKFTDN